MKKKSISKNYIAIQGWMVEELGLKGNELLAYALIYGFSQDGGSAFTGSIAYVQQWLGCARSTAIVALQSLERKGLVRKQDVFHGGMKYCTYAAVVRKSDRGSENQMGVVRNSDKTSPEIGPNNIYNIEDNIEPPMFDEVWGMYGCKGNYQKSKMAYYNLTNGDRQRMCRHLRGSECEVGYLEATEDLGSKYRQNFENYIVNGTWKRPLEEREMLNLELV